MAAFFDMIGEILSPPMHAWLTQASGRTERKCSRNLILKEDKEFIRKDRGLEGNESKLPLNAE